MKSGQYNKIKFLLLQAISAMSIVIKFADLVAQYDGDGEFSEWIQKLELLAKLQRVGELHVVLPLFLSGRARKK